MPISVGKGKSRRGISSSELSHGPNDSPEGIGWSAAPKTDRMEDTVASKERTPEQIRAEIAASRHAMTVGIEGLLSEVHPTAIKNQVVDDAKQAVSDTKQVIYDTVDDTRNYFVDEGGPRWNNIGTVAMVVVSAVVIVAAVGGAAALIRSIGREGK